MNPDQLEASIFLNFFAERHLRSLEAVMAGFCDPLRQQLKAIDDDIASIQDSLEQGDFPPQERPKFQERLQKLRMLGPHVASVLSQCEVAAEGASPPAPTGSNPPS
jgi:hypothetical protein